MYLRIRLKMRHFLLWATVISLLELRSVGADTLYFMPKQRLSNDGSSDNATECSLTMFGGNINAYWACTVQQALQQNWFPSPIAGLETYLNWNGMDGFWQDGSVLETMANFIYYGNNTRYRKVLLASWRDLDSLLHAYHPQPSFDDEAWYGMAYARIYEVTGNSSFLDVAYDIYNWTWSLGWDTSGACHGGFWFDGRYSKKITITNVQMLFLGAKLLRLDPKRDPFLEHKVNLTWTYLTKNPIIHPTTRLVADEIDLATCKPIPKYNITYNTGVMVGALAELFKITNNSEVLELAYQMVAGSEKYLTRGGVLTEYCDVGNSCSDDLDAKMFKGIFMRSLRYLMDVSNETQYKKYAEWVQHNFNQTVHTALCNKPINECNLIFLDGPSNRPHTGPVFGTSWIGTFDEGRPIQQTSALDLFVSSLPLGLRCTGPGCTYDPPLPPIYHIDCKSHPCPKSYTCCTWDKIYHTCCTPGQECYDGGCY